MDQRLDASFDGALQDAYTRVQERPEYIAAVRQVEALNALGLKVSLAVHYEIENTRMESGALKCDLVLNCKIVLTPEEDRMREAGDDR